MASLFSAAASAFFGAVSAATDIAKGWGQNIKWVPFKEGLKMSRETGKPAMIVIHKSWCRACKALKPRFANSREIEAMSNNFIMINVEDDDEPKSPEYKPDGAYIPRILFLDGDGKVMTQVHNRKSDSFKYYYPETDSIVENMRTVISQTSNKTAKVARPVSNRPRGRERH